MKNTDISGSNFFKQSGLSEYFMHEPIGFMDIGARGGSHSLVEPMHSHVSYLGFEPDLEECHALNSNSRLKEYWNEFEVLPHALSKDFGNRSLKMLSYPANSSLLDLNNTFVERYSMEEKWSITHQIPLETCPLDHVMYDLKKGFQHSGEFVKVDVQGVELEILEGASKILTERTVCVVSEVEFFQIYSEQKLFSDVELYLRSLGFSFYGFFTLHTRSKKALNKKKYHGRERLFYADAVFFRDPFSLPAELTQRQYRVLLFSAILTGYLDFALEIAMSDRLTLDQRARDNTRKLIEELAFIDPIETGDQVIRLADRIKTDRESGNLYLGKFIDAVDFPDYSDILI